MAATRRTSLVVAGVLVALAATSRALHADEHNGCAAVNNVSNNRVSIFEIIGATGELKLIQEIPTGGLGDDGGYISIPQIASTAPRGGRACIFVTNSRTNSVSALSIQLGEEHGAPAVAQLATVEPAEPPPDAIFGRLGGGLAVHPDETTLYTSNPGSNNLSTYRVQPKCDLTLSGPRTPAPPAPSDIQVKPDGRCLAVASPVADVVALYGVTNTSDGGRSLVPAGVFPVPGPGRATGVEFSRFVSMDTLYVTKADPARTVIVRFHVRPDCGLEPSPAVTIAQTGRSANVAVLDPDNRCLFVPNQASATVSYLAANHPPSTLTTFAVNAGSGDLTLVATVEDSAVLPAGIGFAENSRGERSLYYTSFSREVFRRRVVGCRPGPVLESIRTGVRGTGLLRGLTIIQ